MFLGFLQNRLVIIFVCAFIGFNSKSADYNRNNLLTYHEDTQLQAYINLENKNSIDIIKHGDDQDSVISFIHPEPVVGASFDKTGKNLLTYGRKFIFLCTIDGTKNIAAVPTLTKELLPQRTQNSGEPVSLYFNFNSQGTRFLTYGAEVVSVWSFPALELLFCQNVIYPKIDGRRQGGFVESVKWVEQHAREISPAYGEESPEAEDVKGGFVTSRSIEDSEDALCVEKVVYVPSKEAEESYEAVEVFVGDGDFYSINSGQSEPEDEEEYSYDQRVADYLTDCTLHEEVKELSLATEFTDEFSAIGAEDVFVGDGIAPDQEKLIHNRK